MWLAPHTYLCEDARQLAGRSGRNIIHHLYLLLALDVSLFQSPVLQFLRYVSACLQSYYSDTRRW